jgi:hypothetical protein
MRTSPQTAEEGKAMAKKIANDMAKDGALDYPCCPRLATNLKAALTE